ncbi:MAG: CYTH domain-containing protein [Coprobacter sp.]|nr:CYTH domain-containing protein [Coprobacter sp.]
MSKEIERKYTVKTTGYRNGALRKYYKQGYLSTDKERTVRVRVTESEGFITVKGKNSGIVRDEYEYPIPASEAHELIENLCFQPVIEKYRYICPVGDVVWEIDEFLGENEGLVLAEVELPDEDFPLELPEWVGEEVTGDARYYNSNLVTHPYRKWK